MIEYKKWKEIEFVSIIQSCLIFLPGHWNMGARGLCTGSVIYRPTVFTGVHVSVILLSTFNHSLYVPGLFRPYIVGLNEQIKV